MNNYLYKLAKCFLLAYFCQITNVLANNEPVAIPSCELTLLDGSKKIALSDYKGKVLYVDFWASWCGPCLKSFPFMNNLDRDLNKSGLQVVAINMDENVNDAKQFLEQNPSSFTIAVDSEQRCAKSFGLKAMPSSYLIDRNGQIRKMHVGFRPDEAEEFRQLVEKLVIEGSQNTGQR